MSVIGPWKWAFLGFLGGIVVHSVFPHATAPMWLLTCFALVLGWAFFYAPPASRSVVCVLCGLVFGVWRFSLVSATLPSVRFLDPGSYLVMARWESAHAPDWLIRYRQALTARIQAALPGDDGALVAGILYGDRVLSRDMTKRFRDAGLTHVIAVSGANLALVVVVIGSLVATLGVAIRTRVTLVCVSILGFVMFVGASASVVRAAIMGCLLLIAPAMGRLAQPKYLLLVAACVFSLWQPWGLAFDLGFQLSVLSLLGIFTYGQWLDRGLEARIPWKTFREAFTSSLAANLFVAPLVAWVFGTWSLWAVPCSILAAFLVPWIMGAGAVALVLPHPWILTFARMWTGALQSVARLPETIPLGIWRDVRFSWMAMLCTYVALWLVYRFVHTRGKKYPHPPLKMR